jgi:DNA polymerase-4
MSGLRTLFVDMNAYFASVEQQDDPRLRGKPIGIVPLKEAFASCCIAISYEAKKFGVKGGMGFREAKRLCPDLLAVQARPERYVEVHKQMVKAVGRVLPVENWPGRSAPKSTWDRTTTRLHLLQCN